MDKRAPGRAKPVSLIWRVFVRAFFQGFARLRIFAHEALARMIKTNKP